MNLKDISDNELKEELTRRKRLEHAPDPKPIDSADWNRLYSMIVQGVNTMAINQYQDEDFRIYIYEAAIEAVYGHEFWAWRNKQNF